MTNILSQIVPLIQSMTTLTKWKCTPCLRYLVSHVYTSSLGALNSNGLSKGFGCNTIIFFVHIIFVVHIWRIMYELDWWTVCVPTRVIINHYFPGFETAEEKKQKQINRSTLQYTLSYFLQDMVNLHQMISADYHNRFLSHSLCLSSTDEVIADCWWPHKFITQHDNYDPSMSVSFVAILAHSRERIHFISCTK